MPDLPTAALISYSREDSEFALRLATDLKAGGANVWIDQLDIRPGSHWDNAIEEALLAAPMMLTILSPAAARSPNVRNEISFALEQGKIVIPVIYKDCIVPLQLQRNNRIDFRADYSRGLSALFGYLGVEGRGSHVVDRAAGAEVIRKAAWEAREADARRLGKLEEEDRHAPQDRPRKHAKPIANEDEESRVLEQRNAKTRMILLFGIALYVVSFFLIVIPGDPIYFGWQCAVDTFVISWGSVRGGFFNAPGLTIVFNFGMLFSALINPVFIVYVLLRMRAGLRKTAAAFFWILLVLNIAPWLVFRTNVPREGYFVWVAGMLTAMFSATIAGWIGRMREPPSSTFLR